MTRGRGKADWVDADLVVCVGGPLAGLWFLRDDWDARVRAVDRMVACGGRTAPYTAYRETGNVVTNPEEPSAVGMELVPE